MKNFILNENFVNGFYTQPLVLLLLSSIICSIFVIIAKNPIVSVLFLIGLYANISAYLILTGSIFVGLSYLLVYIGAISILFIFILMLINIRISELYVHINDNLPLGLMLSVMFYFPFMYSLPLVSLNKFNQNFNIIIN
jgi:NADH-ubiquinone oxidoreductase chain 6